MTRKIPTRITRASGRISENAASPKNGSNTSSIISVP
jgi:hypothetical protein